MAITSNKNSTQQGMSSLGRTGTQVVKLIPASRVYIASPMSSIQAQIPYTLSNGSTPPNFTDLGSLLGTVKVSYDRKVKDVTTGIDNYYRGSYTDGSMSTIEFVLEQFDDVAVEIITSLPSTINTGNSANYQIGQRDLTQLALLLVVQNKLDGKEFQYFNPSALINFSFDESGDSLGIKCSGYLPYFTAAGQALESSMSVTVFSANATQASTSPSSSSTFGSSAYGANFFGA